MQLASRFRNAPTLRKDRPLSDEEIRQVVPSIYASEKHSSRSDRYTYIATVDVLRGLRKEGFEPFMVCQTRTRDENKREHAKHMLRLRHRSQINGTEANEIILLNSHDGTSSYQMLAGMYRFVCSNGLVCGDTLSDIRVPHKGNVIDQVVQGAFDVLDGFTRVVDERDSMKSLALNEGEQSAFARAALALRYEPSETKAAPVTEAQILRPKRLEDRSNDLWTTFQRTQENLVNGGLQGRGANGRAARTRPVQGIDQNVKLNRALWVLAEEMRRLKATA